MVLDADVPHQFVTVAKLAAFAGCETARVFAAVERGVIFWVEVRPTPGGDLMLFERSALLQLRAALRAPLPAVRTPRVRKSFVMAY